MLAVNTQEREFHTQHNDALQGDLPHNPNDLNQRSIVYGLYVDAPFRSLIEPWKGDGQQLSGRWAGGSIGRFAPPFVPPNSLIDQCLPRRTIARI